MYQSLLLEELEINLKSLRALILTEITYFVKGNHDKEIGSIEARIGQREGSA